MADLRDSSSPLPFPDADPDPLDDVGRAADAAPVPESRTEGQTDAGPAGSDQVEVVRAPIAKPWQEFYIPIHGLVRLKPEEVTITNHPAFQRLGEINQLGQVDLVYRGATHRRAEHALGTLHVAKLMIDGIAQNSGLQPRTENGGDWALDEPLSEEEEAFIRLGALVHDVGHLPAGHTLEDELGLLDAHDADKRLNLVLDKDTWHGVRVEPRLRDLIDELYAEWAERTGLGKPASEILLDIISKDRAKVRPAEGSAFRLGVCRDIIGNTICADLLDYLHRDWFHIGKPRYFDTRLIEYMEVRKRLEPRPGQQPSLVIYLRRRDEVRIDAVTAILDLLESRYQLGETALFHHTKLTAAAMLERIIAEMGDALGAERESWLAKLTEELLDCSDTEMLDTLESRARELTRKGGNHAPGLDGAVRLAQALRLRRLHKRLFVHYEHQLGTDALSVQSHYAGAAGARNRLEALRRLELDFALPPGTVVMYCPMRGMHTKIAEVRILIDGSVHTLDEYEGQQHHDVGLTGGHLAAQKARFRRLWRIHLAIQRDVYRRLEANQQLPIVVRAVNDLVIGRTLGAVTREENALSIARELASLEDSPLAGTELAPVGVGERGRTVVRYPTGAPTLRSLIVPNDSDHSA